MKKSKGFTLLELIIVIIVLGILVAIALPQFTKVAERGRIAKAKTVLDMFRKAEGIYFAINSFYTTDEAELANDIPELSGISAADVDWGYVVTTATNTEFLVTATRDTGEYNGQRITINQLGQIGGDHQLEFGTKPPPPPGP